MHKKALATVVLSLFVAMTVSTMGYAKTVIKLGTSTQPTHIYNQAAKYFGDIVAERKRR